MKLNVAFLHPDLGIGGAERAIIDAAIALKNSNYNITIYTNHHDEDHCFEETINGDLNVISIADYIPRSIFGKFCAFFAYLRFLIAALYISIFDNKFDLIYVDQISAPIPLLKLFGFRVLFYGHYPDMLLSQRGGLAKRLYRAGIDWLESASLSYADVILYNSIFTSNVYRKYFPFLRKFDPTILYPVPNVDNLTTTNSDHPFTDDKYKDTYIFLSINRYEWKKNIELGLKAFAIVNEEIKSSGKQTSVHFVHFGGYDELVSENKEVFNYLEELSKSLGINEKVSLLKSCPNYIKVNLLKRSCALLYTPSNEHFGIVPIEAMFLKCPVIAVNSGGPLESVVNNVTGFLCDPVPEQFAKSMSKFIIDGGSAKMEMGAAGHKRVEEHFSFSVFQHKLEEIVRDLITKGERPRQDNKHID